LPSQNAVNKLTFTSLSLFLAIGSTRVFSQELPRPSMARSQTVTALPSDYNLKLGPVLMNVNASMGAEYNSNVALSSSGAQSDFILSPQVGVVAQWPVT